MSEAEIALLVLDMALWSIFMFLFGFSTSFSDGKGTFQSAAVKAGKAEYFLNSDNEREWRWKQ